MTAILPIVRRVEMLVGSRLRASDDVDSQDITDILALCQHIRASIEADMHGGRSVASDLIDLTKARDDRQPHTSGPAVCVGCHHKWHAVIPVGTDIVGCPSCGMHKGVKSSIVGMTGDHWKCKCGGQFFGLIGKGPYCVNCWRLFDWSTFTG